MSIYTTGSLELRGTADTLFLTASHDAVGPKIGIGTSAAPGTTFAINSDLGLTDTSTQVRFSIANNDTNGDASLNLGNSVSNRSFILWEGGADKRLRFGTRASGVNYFNTMHLKDGRIGIGGDPDASIDLQVKGANASLLVGDGTPSVESAIFIGNSNTFIKRPVGSSTVRYQTDRPVIFDTGGAYALYANNFTFKNANESKKIFSISQTQDLADSTEQTKFWVQEDDADLVFLLKDPSGPAYETTNGTEVLKFRGTQGTGAERMSTIVTGSGNLHVRNNVHLSGSLMLKGGIDGDGSFDITAGTSHIYSLRLDPAGGGMGAFINSVAIPRSIYDNEIGSGGNEHLRFFGGFGSGEDSYVQTRAIQVFAARAGLHVTGSAQVKGDTVLTKFSDTPMLKLRRQDSNIVDTEVLGEIVLEGSEDSSHFLTSTGGSSIQSVAAGTWNPGGAVGSPSTFKVLNTLVTTDTPTTALEIKGGNANQAVFHGKISIDSGASAATVAGENATIGYSGTEGITITGQGSTNDVTIRNDADQEVIAIPTGTTNVDIVGVATAATFEPDGDTAAGDSAAVGYTATEGLILTGQGSTNDVTIKNDADQDVLVVPTGTQNVEIIGDLTVTKNDIKGPTGQNLHLSGSGAVGVEGNLQVTGHNILNNSLESVITLDEDQRVGIGGITPTYKLDVNGDIRLRGNDIRDNSGNAAISFNGSAATTINNAATFDGTATFNSIANIVGTTTATQLTISNYNDTPSVPARLDLRKAPVDNTINSGDSIGTVRFMGNAAGSDFYTGALISTVAAQTWDTDSSLDTGTDMIFSVTRIDANAQTEALRIAANSTTEVAITGSAKSEFRDRLTVNHNSSGADPSLHIHEPASNDFARLSFTNAAGMGEGAISGYSHEWTLAGYSGAEGSPQDATFNIFYGDADGDGTGRNLVNVRPVGITASCGIKVTQDMGEGLAGRGMRPTSGTGTYTLSPDPENYALFLQQEKTTGLHDDNPSIAIGFGTSNGNTGAGIYYVDKGNFAQGRLSFGVKSSGITGVAPDLAMEISGDGNGIFSEYIRAATTVNGANVRVNTSTGQLQRVDSDRRGKKDIQDLVSSLEQICQLSPRLFRGIDDPDDSLLVPGFVVDEVEPIFPELVDGLDLPAEQRRGLYYDRFTAHIVNALKEIKERLEALES